MILKNFQLDQINILKKNIILFYGENTGLKKEKIKYLTLNYSKTEKYFFNEKQIIDNNEILYDVVLNHSFFSEKKSIIINDVTEKILNIILNLLDYQLNDIILILNASILEKKSKLRKFFENEKDLICVPFYPDNDQTLKKIANDFFYKKKITISQSDINYIISKCAGNRENLYIQLEKIELFSSKKTINHEELSKLVNLSEDHNISELVDFCLAKDTKKTLKTLNENHFTNEDCIAIIKIFSNKIKRLHKIYRQFEKIPDLDIAIKNAKPPIFWKERNLVEQQLKRLKKKQIEKIIFELNDIELKIKKNFSNSIIIVTDFIIKKVFFNSNNLI